MSGKTRRPTEPLVKSAIRHPLKPTTKGRGMGSLRARAQRYEYAKIRTVVRALLIGGRLRAN